MLWQTLPTFTTELTTFPNPALPRFRTETLVAFMTTCYSSHSNSSSFHISYTVLGDIFGIAPSTPQHAEGHLIHVNSESVVKQIW